MAGAHAQELFVREKVECNQFRQRVRSSWHYAVATRGHFLADFCFHLRHSSDPFVDDVCGTTGRLKKDGGVKFNNTVALTKLGDDPGATVRFSCVGEYIDESRAC